MSSVMTFYAFAPLGGTESLDALRARLEDEARARALKGTLLIAEEGLNGTMTGALEDLDAFRGVLTALPGFEEMPFRFSVADADNPVFYRLKVRIKPEIVALGRPGRQARRADGHARGRPHLEPSALPIRI